MTDTAAIWALTGALLVLAGVIAVVGYVWATTSPLGTSREVIEPDEPWFNWPVLAAEPDNEAGES